VNGHTIREIFYRADEMNHHPLHWEWSHWFTRNSLRQRGLWIAYRLRCWAFPRDILTHRRPGW